MSKLTVGKKENQEEIMPNFQKKKKFSYKLMVLILTNLIVQCATNLDVGWALFLLGSNMSLNFQFHT